LPRLFFIEQLAFYRDNPVTELWVVNKFFSEMESSEQIQRLLEPARGWLALGAWLAANQELENLPHELKTHHEVLKLRCKIYRVAQSWSELTVLAESFTKIYPNVLSFWIEWVLGRTQTG
jgi:hypothetical protein